MCFPQISANHFSTVERYKGATSFPNAGKEEVNMKIKNTSELLKCINPNLRIKDGIDNQDRMVAITEAADLNNFENLQHLGIRNYHSFSMYCSRHSKMLTDMILKKLDFVEEINTERKSNRDLFPEEKDQPEFSIRDQIEISTLAQILKIPRDQALKALISHSDVVSRGDTIKMVEILKLTKS